MRRSSSGSRWAADERRRDHGLGHRRAPPASAWRPRSGCWMAAQGGAARPAELRRGRDRGRARAAARFVAADVTSEEQVLAALEATAELGEPRALVHCAGRGAPVRTIDRDGNPAPLALFAEIVNLNLVGSFNVLRLAAARMARNEPHEGDRGVCVLTASAAAFEGQIGQIPYAASKAGVARDDDRRRPRPRRPLIRVCTIAPGTSKRRCWRRGRRRCATRWRRPRTRAGSTSRRVRPAGGPDRREPDAERGDDPARRGDPDGAAMSSRVGFEGVRGPRWSPSTGPSRETPSTRLRRGHRRRAGRAGPADEFAV